MPLEFFLKHKYNYAINCLKWFLLSSGPHSSSPGNSKARPCFAELTASSLNLPLYRPPHLHFCLHFPLRYYSPEMSIHLSTFPHDALLCARNILVSLYNMTESHASFKAQVDYPIISESSCKTSVLGRMKGKRKGTRKGLG